jgi:hypothetical protein
MLATQDKNKDKSQKIRKDIDCENKTCHEHEVLMKPCTLYIWGPECSICKVATCPENATEVLDVWMNCPVVTCQKKPTIDTLSLDDKILIGCGASSPVLFALIVGIYVCVKNRQTQIVPVEVIKKNLFL